MDDFPVAGDLIVLEFDGYDHLSEALDPAEREGTCTVCSEVKDGLAVVAWSSGTQKLVYLDHVRSRFSRTGPRSWTVGPVIGGGIFFVRVR